MEVHISDINFRAKISMLTFLFVVISTHLNCEHGFEQLTAADANCYQRMIKIVHLNLKLHLE